MPEIILHVFDSKSGKELAEAQAFTPDTTVFSFITDDILDSTHFADKDATKALRSGKTRGQDFIDRVLALKAQAMIELPCTKNYCHWCKDCFNKVCDALNISQHKI